jgi:Zn-dependent protease with chaperone function
LKGFTIKQFEITGHSNISRTRSLIGDRFPQARRILPLVLSMAMLAACSTTPQGRKQLTAPAPISNVYSDVDMRIRLATVANATCLGAECARNLEFDQQVQRLGFRLSEAAFETDPDLNKRISHFEFVVAEKEKPGTASNASGTVVIFRGVQKLGLDDEALAFLIAREMGHIICQHHNENSSAKILVSVLASVLFPALSLFTGSAAVANVTSATVSTTAASTATSFLGSQAVVASIKPTQSSEADAVALGLLSGLGWDEHEVSSSLEACTQIDGDDTWAQDFRISVGHLKALDDEAGAASVSLKGKPSSLQIAHDTTQKSSVRSTLIDSPVDDVKVELNGNSGQTPGKGIKASEAETVSDAGEIIVNAARSGISLNDAEATTDTSVIVQSDNGKAASDATTNPAIEDLQGSDTESTLTGGEEVKIMPGGAKKQGTPKSTPDRAKSPKKTRLPAGASGQVSKMKVNKGAAKKTTSGNKPDIKNGKGKSQPAKFKSSVTAAAGKHDSVKKAPAPKGSKLTHGGKAPKSGEAKVTRAASNAKQKKNKAAQ